MFKVVGQGFTLGFFKQLITFEKPTEFLNVDIE